MTSNTKRALCYIVPCLLLAVLLNFSKFFETETVRFCLDFTSCGCGYHSRLYVRPTSLRLSQVNMFQPVFYQTEYSGLYSLVHHLDLGQHHLHPSLPHPLLPQHHHLQVSYHQLLSILNTDHFQEAEGGQDCEC